MYRIVLTCYGIPAQAGPEAAVDIRAEFKEDRHWWSNVECTWDGTRLVLQADNDVDDDGTALSDEFSDCVCAYVKELTDIEFKIESVTRLSA